MLETVGTHGRMQATHRHARQGCIGPEDAASRQM